MEPFENDLNETKTPDVMPSQTMPGAPTWIGSLTRPLLAVTAMLALIAAFAISAPAPASAATNVGCLAVTTSTGERIGIRIINGEPAGRCTPPAGIITISIAALAQSLHQQEAQILRAALAATPVPVKTPAH